MVFTFNKNKNNKIEFTEKELADFIKIIEAECRKNMRSEIINELSNKPIQCLSLRNGKIV